MAKSRRASGGGSTKNSKNNKQKKDNKKNKPNSKSRSSNNSGVKLPSHKSNAPPWQVLSPKDAKKNAQREQKRRELAKEGIQMEEDDDETAVMSLSGTLLSEADQKLTKWRPFNPSTTPYGMKLIGSYLSKKPPPRLGVPEIAFLGRSNVGKSSLLNRLSSRVGGDEARVGKTPGATASVNLYALLGKPKQKYSMQDAKIILGLTDLPGFGYAKLARVVQDKIQVAAERYLGKRKELALGILLVDARRVPSEDDRTVLASLYDLGLPIVVVATKIDKLSKKELEPAMESIRDRLGLPDGQPLCVSSVTGEGTKELWRIMMEACESKVEEVINELKKTSTEDDDNDTIQLDDEGNLRLPDSNEDDDQYSQGYDWLQDSPIVYDYGPDNTNEEVTESRGNNVPEEQIELAAMKLKDLQKITRRMEREGEI
eukprot:CAMPEP_0194172676 /NCGR_PEP_ID=MMETSP0154-20130528/7134_1 /TAXON_ID=1049557 /ORGANISM="Thalassiothrix antarctica, Strain L6-D1" /LENGTH=427 /DNA_ID=CAMNT_0038885463 /DNA_START=114 /DNA_END=1397 /DNA_ORIENTATION=-